MVGEIAGRPHWEISLDEQGKLHQGEADALLRELPGEDLTDLFVFSHGWNNDRGQARRLYQLYFQQLPGLLAQGGAQTSASAPSGGVAVQALDRRARADRRRRRGGGRRRRPG